MSGGTGSGKTTLLNCLTQFIDNDERIITCEDAAELQLQQPHTVRLETRPPNLEGEGQITMRDLVRNCLRMRPERIIVGEVRGPEAFDLLQAMNTGHDGSMGTLHANSPREALSRVESMITMGGYSLPSRTIREMISGSIDVIVQAARLRDGSRRITHITEVMGMEGDVIITQDLFVYDMIGEDAQGNLIGRHRSTGIGRPEVLGPRALLRRGAAARGRARRGRGRERADDGLTGSGGHAVTRPVLPGRRRDRRRRLGVHLSDAVRRAAGGAAQGDGRQDRLGQRRRARRATRRNPAASRSRERSRSSRTGRPRSPSRCT